MEMTIGTSQVSATMLVTSLRHQSQASKPVASTTMRLWAIGVALKAREFRLTCRSNHAVIMMVVTTVTKVAMPAAIGVPRIATTWSLMMNLAVASFSCHYHGSTWQAERFKPTLPTMRLPELNASETFPPYSLDYGCTGYKQVW